MNNEVLLWDSTHYSSCAMGQGCKDCSFRGWPKDLPNPYPLAGLGWVHPRGSLNSGFMADVSWQRGGVLTDMCKKHVTVFGVYIVHIDSRFKREGWVGQKVNKSCRCHSWQQWLSISQAAVVLCQNRRFSKTYQSRSCQRQWCLE